MTAGAIAAAFESACIAELQALKPGNVHIFADGHGMTVADFEVSAKAAAPYIAETGKTVGERVWKAVKAINELLAQNTNLGIILLCTPLAVAWEQAGGRGLREALRDLLARLTQHDAMLVYQAIALANPGGLGQLSEHDVRTKPEIPLIEAMRLAAQRDHIAYQYVSTFADVFEVGLLVADGFAQLGADDVIIAERVYWRFLTRFPDSHIARKYGMEKAEEICKAARAVDDDFVAASDVERKRLLLAFDTWLKAHKINPGTSADLTVSTLFTQKLIAL